MKVRLTSRRSADARCAYCHDSLDGVVSSCPRCLITFHKDCRAHLAQCPTLGCGTTFTHAPELVIEPEAEAPAGLADELLREKLNIILVGVAAAVLLAALLAAMSWNRDVLVVAGFLALGVVWSLGTLLRDAGFYLALPGLMRRAPVRMAIELRSEARGPVEPGEAVERVFTARLMGQGGELISLDLGSVLPAWVLAPGAQVDVFSAESGPVAIRSLKGHVYAVPARRVTRHIG